MSSVSARKYPSGTLRQMARERGLDVDVEQVREVLTEIERSDARTVLSMVGAAALHQKIYERGTEEHALAVRWIEREACRLYGDRDESDVSLALIVAIERDLPIMMAADLAGIGVGDA